MERAGHQFQVLPDSDHGGLWNLIDSLNESPVNLKVHLLYEPAQCVTVPHDVFHCECVAGDNFRREDHSLGEILQDTLGLHNFSRRQAVSKERRGECASRFGEVVGIDQCQSIGESLRGAGCGKRRGHRRRRNGWLFGYGCDFSARRCSDLFHLNRNDFRRGRWFNRWLRLRQCSRWLGRQLHERLIGSVVD